MVKYGQMNVDEKYSKIVEPNLYYDNVFAPGITFSEKYDEDEVGGIFVHKLSTTPCEVGTPGRDFVNEDLKDELIPIVFNNNFQKSKKIYGVQKKAVGIQLANEKLKGAVAEVKEGWAQGANACLFTEGTTSAETTAITDAKKAIIAERTALSKKKGKANTLLCSPDFYGLLLSQYGDEFTPVTNEKVLATGVVGKFLGMNVIEDNGLSAVSAKYYNAGGTLKTATFGKVQFIMYDFNALSVLNNLLATRIVDTTDFVGSLAQVEMNTAYAVTNKDLVVVRTDKTV